MALVRYVSDSVVAWSRSAQPFFPLFFFFLFFFYFPYLLYWSYLKDSIQDFLSWFLVTFWFDQNWNLTLWTSLFCIFLPGLQFIFSDNLRKKQVSLVGVLWKYFVHKEAKESCLLFAKRVKSANQSKFPIEWLAFISSWLLHQSYRMYCCLLWILLKITNHSKVMPKEISYLSGLSLTLIFCNAKAPKSSNKRMKSAQVITLLT